VRVIAATNKPLEQAVAARQFREDLFYRLNVVRIAIPPLRERAGDIPLLVNYFLRKFAAAQRTPKSIARDALRSLGQYAWPGNVRELENAIRRALVVAKGDVILVADLPAGIAGGGRASTSVAPPTTVGATAPASSAVVPSEVPALAQGLFRIARRDPKLKILPAVERELIIQALLETKGNQVQSASLLGITRATLRNRIEKFKIRQEIAIQ
jgi:DNA-binding NtrC family response regulator